MMSNLAPVGSAQKARTKKMASPASADDTTKDWTVKNLPAETVHVSREAAKRSGMKINAWVARALDEAASESTHVQNSVQPLAANVDPSINRHILDEISKLREQNESLKQTLDSMSTILLRMCAERL